MQPGVLLLSLLAFSSMAYYIGRKRGFMTAGGKQKSNTLHSRPVYYGMLTALWCGIPALIVISIWLSFEDVIIISQITHTLPPNLKNLPADQFSLVINDIKDLVSGNIVSQEASAVLQQAAVQYKHLTTISHTALTAVSFIIAAIGIVIIRRKISPSFRARNHVEKVVGVILIACSTFAIFTTVGIVLSVLYESIQFFETIPLLDFLFGLEWSPQIAIRADQAGSSGAFGAIPVFVGTLLITVIAMIVAVPIGLMSAIYLSEYANRRIRKAVKPVMEILAGIPTVVYGFFAALTVAPFLRRFGQSMGLDISSESALAAGGVMGIMIIPFISSISDDVINAVPQALRDGFYGLGATKSETITQVVIPAALPGNVGGVLLAISRAIGETMIVVMAAGLTANLTVNPLKTVTTVTVQIVTLLVGDQEFDSPKTLAAFALGLMPLGLMLFITTLILIIIALSVKFLINLDYETSRNSVLPG